MSHYFQEWMLNIINKNPKNNQIVIIQENLDSVSEIQSNDISVLTFKNGKINWKNQIYDIIIVEPHIISNNSNLDIIHQLYNHLSSNGRLFFLSQVSTCLENQCYFWDSKFEEELQYKEFKNSNQSFQLNITNSILNLNLLNKYFNINYQSNFSPQKSSLFVIYLEGLKKNNVIVQSLWIGSRLSNLEKLSINSFIKNGHDFHLYTYGPVEGIPPETTIKDGNDILPESEIFCYLNTRAGSSSVSAFSNIFRFKLLYLKGNYWVDTDMVCTQFLNISEPYLFTTEPVVNKCYKRETINAGIIKLPIYSPESSLGVKICYNKKVKIIKGNLKWGLGPTTTKQVINRFNLQPYVKPWYFSNSCGCSHWKSLLQNFNWKFYLRNYPELKEKGINNHAKAREHWNTIGKKEGKLGLPIQEIALIDLNKRPEGNYAIHLWNQYWNRNNQDKDSNYNPECLFEQLKQKYLK